MVVVFMNTLSEYAKKKARKSGKYTNATFKQVIEDHLTYLKTHTSTKSGPIPPELAGRYPGDYYSLLLHLGIPADQWWITLRLNGMTNPSQFIGTEDTIVMCDIGEIKRLYAISGASM